MGRSPDRRLDDGPNCMPTRSPLPSQSYLREALRYDPDTGDLYWQKSIAARAQAGQKAFSRVQSSGHKKGRIAGVSYFAHRVVWKMLHGTEPDQIDHIDGDPGNNRASNLRAADSATNARNRKLTRSSTGIIGVSRFRKGYRADITVNREQIFLGAFPTLEEAARVRAAASAKYGFHENHGRS